MTVFIPFPFNRVSYGKETYLEVNKAISEPRSPLQMAGLSPPAVSQSYDSIDTLLSAETTEAINHLITKTYSFQIVLSTKRNVLAVSQKTNLTWFLVFCTVCL